MAHGFYVKNLRSVTAWLIYHDILQKALVHWDFVLKHASKNDYCSISLKTAVLKPLSYLVHFFQFYYYTELDIDREEWLSDADIVKKIYERGLISLGFYELYMKLLEWVSLLRNHIDAQASGQCDEVGIYEGKNEVGQPFFTQQEWLGMQIICDGFLRPMEQLLGRLTNELEKPKQLINLDFISAFLRLRKILWEQDESHPLCDVLRDYPDAVGWSPYIINQERNRQIIIQQTLNPLGGETNYKVHGIHESSAVFYLQEQIGLSLVTEESYRVDNCCIKIISQDNELDFFCQCFIVELLLQRLGFRLNHRGYLVRVIVSGDSECKIYWAWLVVTNEILLEQVLDLRFSEKFCLIDPSLVFSEWLADCQKFITQHSASLGLCANNMLSTAQVIQNLLYINVRELQSCMLPLLLVRNSISYYNVLLGLDVELRALYKSWSKIIVTMNQAHQRSLASLSISSSSRVTMPSSTLIRDRDATDQMADLRQIVARMRVRMQAPATFFQSISFRLMFKSNNKPHYLLQTYFLELMQGGSYLELNFSYCVVLTKEILLRFIRANPNVISLDISHCVGLSNDMPSVISTLKGLRSLRRLGIDGLSIDIKSWERYLKDLPGIQEFGFRLPMLDFLYSRAVHGNWFSRGIIEKIINLKKNHLLRNY